MVGPVGSESLLYLSVERKELLAKVSEELKQKKWLEFHSERLKSVDIIILSIISRKPKL